MSLCPQPYGQLAFLIGVCSQWGQPTVVLSAVRGKPAAAVCNLLSEDSRGQPVVAGFVLGQNGRLSWMFVGGRAAIPSGVPLGGKFAIAVFTIVWKIARFARNVWDGNLLLQSLISEGGH